MVNRPTLRAMPDATWTRPDGAHLVLIGRRLSLRRAAGDPWEPVRTIEGTRRARHHQASLWANANGFTPAAHDQQTGPVPTDRRTKPRGPTIRVVVMPLGGQPRIPVDMAWEAGRWWARRQAAEAWSCDEHCATAIGHAVDLPAEHRVVLAAAVRAMRRLDRMPKQAA